MSAISNLLSLSLSLSLSLYICTVLFLVHSRDRPQITWSGTALDVLEEVGLFTIDEYIQRRRNAIAMYVAERPVFALCVNESRRPGTSHHKKYWWEQTFTLEETLEDM